MGPLRIRTEEPAPQNDQPMLRLKSAHRLERRNNNGKYKAQKRNHRASLGDFLSNNADYVSGICNWQQEQKWIILTVDKQ
jgi:hypothetical protein